MSRWHLVLCPLTIEWRALTESLKESWAHRIDESGRGPLLLFPEKQLACAVGGQGKVQFALQAQALGRSLKAQSLICLGTAGALSPDIKPLDVVMATKTIEHDFKVKFITKKPPEFAGPISWLNEASSFSAFQLHKGPIASGDEDVLDPVRAQEIQELTKAVAVAWEGAGGARASRFLKVPFLELRGISDQANRHLTQEELKKNVQSSIRNCAEVLKSLPF